MTVFERKPESFFELVLHDELRAPGVTGACAGYEGGRWRYESLADYLFEWLPEFALKYSDLEDLNSATAMRLIRRAAKTVFNTPKYQKRGEFGELLLHALIREVFDSQPAISKIYYKSSVNETVKGFDAVHVVDDGGDLELWLGEVKFYKNIDNAIYDVTKEIKDHLDHDYLHDEFILIASKVDSRWKHAEKFKRLISERTSLDAVFKCICIPVMLTYESETVGSFTSSCDDYKRTLCTELEGVYTKFSSKDIPPIRVHLFLVPLDKKDLLVNILQEKLEGLQR